MLKKRSEVKKEYNNYRAECSESEPERMLFEKLTISGFRPKKQFKIGKYFADLAYPEEKIVIEYDGKHHQNQKKEDIERQNYIENKGLKVFRIRNIGYSHGIFEVENLYGKI